MDPAARLGAMEVEIMTMPNERARALRLAGEILRKMLARVDVPEDLRDQARVTLRHYPDSDGLKQMLTDIDRLPREFLDQRWLATEDAGQGHTTGAAPGNVTKSQSTMSENESKGLQLVLDLSECGCVRPVGREFGSLDYDRLEELDTLACQVLGLNRFREWLDTPIPAFDGKTPEEISASPGGMVRIRLLLLKLKEERPEQSWHPRTE